MNWSFSVYFGAVGFILAGPELVHDSCEYGLWAYLRLEEVVVAVLEVVQQFQYQLLSSLGFGIGDV